MHIQHTRWWSPSLDRDMELMVCGHAGTPVLVFPSSMGRFYEWKDFGMIDALVHQIEGGHNTLYCVDSVDAESLYNRSVDPFTRLMRHQQYERYLLQEVLPLIRHRSRHDFLIVTGASFGAYHAANMLFKHPWQVSKLIALSGVYDIRRFLDGFYDENVYFNNPVDYLSNLTDLSTLDALRRTHIVLTTGEYDPCKDTTYHLSRILHEKGIPHTVDQVEGFGHDWPWWRGLIHKHIQ